MLAVANLVWMKLVGATVFFIVGLLVLRKDPRYSLNQLFSISFLLFGASQLFDYLKDVLWGWGYTFIVFSRDISIITGIISTGLFLLVGIYVRYGAHSALNRNALIGHVLIWTTLSIAAIIDQIIETTPHPVFLTQITTGPFGMIALFIVTSLFVLISTIMLFSASRHLTHPTKRQSIRLLALGMLVLVIGAASYGLEGLFQTIDPYTFMLRLALSATGLLTWLLGAIFCLLAFRHRF